METFDFSVIASGPNPHDDDFEARFFDAGCDDATVSFQKGHIILDFAREAASIADAVASAVSAVRAAGATVHRVEPDPLVSLTDIATRAGMTKAAISNYTHGKRGRNDFPAPVVRVTSESPLWDWATVARWLYENDKLSREVVIAAAAVSQANAILDAGEESFGIGLALHVRRYEESFAA